MGPYITKITFFPHLNTLLKFYLHYTVRKKATPKNSPEWL